MPDDPRAKLFFDHWEKDTHEGITLRALHNRLTGHMDRTEQQFRNHSREMGAIKERVAKVEQNDQRDAEDRAASDTGRFRTPGGIHIPTPVQPIPVPFPMPSAPSIHVHGGSVGGEYIGAGAQIAQGGSAQRLSGAAGSSSSSRSSSKRPSGAPFSWSFLRVPAQKAVGYGLTALVAAGATLGIHTATSPAAPAAPAPKIVYLPAPPVESPELTSTAAFTATPPATTSSSPDAGARRPH